MGYTIQIGEAELDYDNCEDYPDVRVRAKDEEHDYAPAYGEPTDYTNRRWPSYSGWEQFATFVGLHDLWFNEDRGDRLLADHPGVVPLTKKHVDEINRCMVAYMKKYPDAVPTYGKYQGKAYDESNPVENGELCRLTWLHYWANWAIKNCEHPVVYNS